jgi:hypothetical protein
VSEIETLSESAIVVLVALRDASARRHEPTAAHPDGHHTRFTVIDLVALGLALGGDTSDYRGIAGLDKTARGLYKRHLASRVTLHSRAYYGLTDQGIALVARIEEEAGVTELVAAEHAHQQAVADHQATELRRHEASAALMAARKRAGVRYPLAAVLDYRREFPLGRQS